MSKRVLYMIDYFATDRDVPDDCYPDFVENRAEAERIAPVFMREIPWAVRYQIRAIIEEE